MATLSPITVARFWSKVSVLKSEDECWHWLGAFNGSGYGSFRVPDIGRVTDAASRGPPSRTLVPSTMENEDGRQTVLD